MLPIAVIGIIFDAVISAIPSVFMQNVLAVVEDTFQSGDWSAASGTILRLVGILVALYVLSLIAGFTHTQLMAIITQGSLAKMREKMFDGMQNLPIKYFDTHNHGDVMSYYTNDIDTLRQMISQSFPNLLRAVVLCGSVLFIMLYYSVWLTLLVLLGVALHGGCRQKGGRRLRPVLPPPAAGHRQDRGLCGGDDERPEGHQGLLPRGGRQGRL